MQRTLRYYCTTIVEKRDYGCQEGSGTWKKTKHITGPVFALRTVRWVFELTPPGVQRERERGGKQRFLQDTCLTCHRSEKAFTCQREEGTAYRT
ncbi:hypothetical protein ANANG_G00205040 [Anguilla anguilla]|uniref:Uncharacterized protein n=1 Tax=Anguilla anguilla TaxID=7936 RepID=A0A9D3LYP4_ANGAN|nr:hypothetical protein ANANG_G00205040 [Anguilla anguilla]